MRVMEIIVARALGDPAKIVIGLALIFTIAALFAAYRLITLRDRRRWMSVILARLPAHLCMLGPKIGPNHKTAVYLTTRYLQRKGFIHIEPNKDNPQLSWVLRRDKGGRYLAAHPPE